MTDSRAQTGGGTEEIEDPSLSLIAGNEGVKANKAGYSGFSSLIRAAFSEPAAFEGGSINRLRVDGQHTEAAVRGDVESWLQKRSALGGGRMLLHDVIVSEQVLGVAAVLRQFTVEPCFGFVCGLGAVGVGESSSVPVGNFLEEDGDAAARRDIANFFTGLVAPAMMLILTGRLSKIERNH